MVQSRPIDISDTISTNTTPAISPYRQGPDSLTPSTPTSAGSAISSRISDSAYQETGSTEGRQVVANPMDAQYGSAYARRPDSAKRSINAALNAHDLTPACAPTAAAGAESSQGSLAPNGSTVIAPMKPYSTYPPLMHFERVWRWLVWAATTLAYIVTLPWQVGGCNCSSFPCTIWSSPYMCHASDVPVSVHVRVYACCLHVPTPALLAVGLLQKQYTVRGNATAVQRDGCNTLLQATCA